MQNYAAEGRQCLLNPEDPLAVNCLVRNSRLE